MKKSKYLILAVSLLVCCKQNTTDLNKTILTKKTTGITLAVLGNVQDAGSPHVACKKDCCSDLFENPVAERQVVSLGIIDHVHEKTFLLEATPDITSQAKYLKSLTSWNANELPDGIFLTHAHIGHYTGLMYLGKEATNASNIPVYAMPKMTRFLKENGPWSQLVREKNISIRTLTDQKEQILTNTLKIIPFTVPHRDEYSETVGYKIIGSKKSALFIPDIDKWKKWSVSIISEIGKVDYAFLDATFYNGEELNTRDVSQIPHPFIFESMELFNSLAKKEKEKIYFIHFNHTNPLLNETSWQTQQVLTKGFNIARKGMLFEL